MGEVKLDNVTITSFVFGQTVELDNGSNKVEVDTIQLALCLDYFIDLIHNSQDVARDEGYKEGFDDGVSGREQNI